MSDLKPCPFCGKEVGYDIRDAEGNLRDADYLLDPWSGVSYTIRHEHELSPDCPIASFSDEILGVLLFDNLDALHESWNTRVEPPDPATIQPSVDLSKVLTCHCCCEVGAHEHDISIVDPSGKVISVDVCMVPVLRKLWDAGVITMASCCGHGKNQASVGVHPGSRNRMVKLGYEADAENDLWFYASNSSSGVTLRETCIVDALNADCEIKIKRASKAMLDDIRKRVCKIKPEVFKAGFDQYWHAIMDIFSELEAKI